MMIKRYILHTGFVLPLILLLAACQTSPIDKADSSNYTVPVGSKLVLKQEITIPADRASVYLQGGAIKSYADTDIAYPHCIFEVREVRPEPQTVAPDTFLITKVVQQVEVAIYGPVHVAALNGVSKTMMFVGDGPSREPYSTIMRLESPTQPQVLQINCRQWEDPTDAYHVTINEIKTVLGEIFTLELAR